MDKSNIVAIYTRLSAEDRDKLNTNDESRSIQNQKSMLISYATNQGWEIYQIYSDDDYQGSDRSRPAFNQLLEDAYAGHFGIVLCKSQARFTRELEMVEKIIHKDFAERNIRFIGYADNADTENKGNKKARQINGLVNEWYLEDLSQNIKTALNDRRQKGHHIGSFALYGYKKDPDKKGHLLIDEPAAEIVKEVFTLYANGMGRVNIARILNERGVPNPTLYKIQNGLRYRGNGGRNSGLWKYSAISDMLSNEMYIGNMVQGKYENKTYKSMQSTPVPKERWIRVKNTHEPIIDQELWQRVQEIRNSRTKPFQGGKVGIFSKKCKCKYCGYFMHQGKNRGYRYFKCSQKEVGADCKGSFVAVRFLEQAVVDELNSIINCYFNNEEAEKRISLSENLQQRKVKIVDEIKVAGMTIKKNREAIRNLYIDKVSGIITESDFVFLKNEFEEIISRNEAMQESLREKLSVIEESMNKQEDKLEILKKYRNVAELNRFMVDTLIDYIEIGRDDNKKRNQLPPITIHWKF